MIDIFSQKTLSSLFLAFLFRSFTDFASSAKVWFESNQHWTGYSEECNCGSAMCQWHWNWHWHMPVCHMSSTDWSFGFGLVDPGDISIK